MLIALTILGLYFWAVFDRTAQDLSGSIIVTDYAAILAAVAFMVAFVSYLWAPREYIMPISLFAYFVLAATTATLIFSTGGTSSPFIALWMMIAIFAGVFGLYGVLPMLAATTGYLIFAFLNHTLTREAILVTVLAGELPLIISYLVWHVKAKTESGDDRAYKDLANELSQVANSSEVVINAIADGVIALNSKGIIELINPAAQRMIGWGKQDAMSLNYQSVLKLTDSKNNTLTPANDPVLQALNTNQQISTNNLTLLTNSDKKLLISMVVSPAGAAGSGVIIVFRDITKEKAEEREQAEFISTASHEMRTPVAAIEGYLGLALNPATSKIDDKARDFINKAHEAAQHLGRLFQDLLDVSKADDSRLANNPKVVDLVAFTKDIIDGLTPKAEEKGLTVTFKPLLGAGSKSTERRLNPVFYSYVDNDHLREVIANLLENAIKYTLKGTVVVDVTGDTEHVTVSVADSGIGIPKEDLPHLFQKFYRVDNSDTREIGGTGLGLYLCRRLAEAMNGRIWLESEYKQGSTFYLEIPRIEHAEATRLTEAAEVQKAKEDAEAAAAVIENPPSVATPAPSVPAPTAISSPVAAPAPPVVTPVTTPNPVTVTTVPTITQSSTYISTVDQMVDEPAAAPQPQPVIYNRPNISLSSIEEHPEQYQQAVRTTGISIPVRNGSNSQT